MREGRTWCVCVFKFLNWLWHTTLAASPTHSRAVSPVAENNRVVFIWIFLRGLRQCLAIRWFSINTYTCQMAKKGLKATKWKWCRFLPPCLANTRHLMNVAGCDHNDVWKSIKTAVRSHMNRAYRCNEQPLNGAGPQQHRRKLSFPLSALQQTNPTRETSEKEWLSSP